MAGAESGLITQEDGGLREQRTEARHVFDWPVQQRLEALPRVVVQHEPATIGQYLLSARGGALEKEFRHALVEHSRSSTDEEGLVGRCPNVQALIAGRPLNGGHDPCGAAARFSSLIGDPSSCTYVRPRTYRTDR